MESFLILPIGLVHLHALQFFCPALTVQGRTSLQINKWTQYLGGSGVQFGGQPAGDGVRVLDLPGGPAALRGGHGLGLWDYAPAADTMHLPFISAVSINIRMWPSGAEEVVQDFFSQGYMMKCNNHGNHIAVLGVILSWNHDTLKY